jgi:hypothetical protein
LGGFEGSRLPQKGKLTVCADACAVVC